MATDKSDTHEMRLQVTKGNVPLVKQLLDNVELSDAIESFEVRIESHKPILAGEDMGAGKTKSEPGPEPQPEPKPDTSHPTDELTNGHKDDESEQKGGEYISNEPDIELPENPSVSDFPAIPLNPETNKWATVATMWDIDGRTTTKQLHEATRRRGFDVNYSGVSSSITTLLDVGLIDAKKPPGKNKRQYQLTGMGRQYVEAVNSETEGWNLPTKNASKE